MASVSSSVLRVGVLIGLVRLVAYTNAAADGLVQLMGPTHSQPDLYMSWVDCLVTKSCQNAKWLLQAFGVLQETQEIMAIADDVKCRWDIGSFRGHNSSFSFSCAVLWR